MQQSDGNQTPHRTEGIERDSMLAEGTSLSSSTTAHRKPALTEEEVDVLISRYLTSTILVIKYNFLLGGLSVTRPVSDVRDELLLSNVNVMDEVKLHNAVKDVMGPSKAKMKNRHTIA
uniref:Uncharacterized protein n=1 Tax=Palpitomonas bilix TaxID=652834 RepID=A0A7S3GME6_9EUKA